MPNTPPCPADARWPWANPSPPASGNAYRESALRAVFPIPVSKQHSKTADFFAIYGIALIGSICAHDGALGGCGVHRKAGERRSARKSR